MNLASLNPKLIMADFKPFQAWRYNSEKVSMQKVIAPPYDIISPEGQKKLYTKSPHNCVRLILNQEEPSDNPAENRYTRARDFFNDWRSEKILVQEKEPCFYLYRQIFKNPAGGRDLERMALLGRIKLEPFEKGIVVPHEKTLSKPREDRRKLLEATETNFSPVFGLYEDPKSEISSSYLPIKNRAPLFDVRDDEGVRHTIWKIHNPRVVEAIHASMSTKKIYIADGHHRYQTALEYAREKHSRDGIPPETVMPFDYALMALVEFHDPGLVLFPTHRVLSAWPGLDRAKALAASKIFFKVESYSLQELRETLDRTPKEKMVFGLVLDNEQYLLTLEDIQQVKQQMPAGKPDIWYGLDVSILSHFIFSYVWNLPESLWESVIQYTHSTEEAIDRVKSKKSAAAFLLRAPQVEILREMGQVNQLMPQKSTYFYPKLASGLVFYHHNESFNS